MTSATQPHSRFAFVDALRGLAALWVAGFHFYGGISQGSSQRTFCEPFHTLLSYGNCGVEIFFVLSGFVIAYTLRQARVTPGYIGNFIFRRSLRLEPPYWATIILAMGVTCLANLARSDRVAPLPSGLQLLAHLVYLQHVLHLGSIVEVFWTLCVEVQFYLTFVLLLALVQRMSGPCRQGNSRQPWLLLALVPLTFWSIAVQADLVSCPRGFMIKFWCLFQLGTLAWWTLEGRFGSTSFWSLVAVLLGLQIRHFSVEHCVGILTGVSLFVAGKSNGLCWLDWPVLQYFGRLSYSFYLVHTVVGGPFVYFLASRLGGPAATTFVRLGLFGAAFAVSITAAHLMYRFIEKPCMEFSKRFKAHQTPFPLTGGSSLLGLPKPRLPLGLGLPAREFARW